jgi:hypothetical protein
MRLFSMTVPTVASSVESICALALTSTVSLTLPGLQRKIGTRRLLNLQFDAASDDGAQSPELHTSGSLGPLATTEQLLGRPLS